MRPRVPNRAGARLDTGLLLSPPCDKLGRALRSPKAARSLFPLAAALARSYFTSDVPLV